MRFFGGLRRETKTQPNKFVAKYSPPRTKKVFKILLASANLHSNVFWQFQLEQAILFFCNFFRFARSLGSWQKEKFSTLLSSGEETQVKLVLCGNLISK